jgi:hypothetical protein
LQFHIKIANILKNTHMKNNIQVSEGKDDTILICAQSEQDKIFLNQTLVSFFGIEEVMTLPNNDSFFFQKNGEHCASLRWFDSRNGILKIDSFYKEKVLAHLSEILFLAKNKEPSY